MANSITESIVSYAHEVKNNVGKITSSRPIAVALATLLVIPPLALLTYSVLGVGIFAYTAARRWSRGKPIDVTFDALNRVEKTVAAIPPNKRRTEDFGGDVLKKWNEASACIGSDHPGAMGMVDYANSRAKEAMLNESCHDDVNSILRSESNERVSRSKILASVFPQLAAAGKVKGKHRHRDVGELSRLIVDGLILYAKTITSNNSDPANTSGTISGLEQPKQVVAFTAPSFSVGDGVNDFKGDVLGTYTSDTNMKEYAEGRAAQLMSHLIKNKDVKNITELKLVCDDYEQSKMDQEELYRKVLQPFPQLLASRNKNEDAKDIAKFMVEFILQYRKLL